MGVGVRKKVGGALLALSVLAGSFAFPSAGLATGDRNDGKDGQHQDGEREGRQDGKTSKLNVQLVCDQKSAVEGGLVSVHILYQNVSVKKMEKASLKLKLSGKLEVAEAVGAEWDAAAGLLLWNLKDVAGGSAGVVHLNLKVKNGAAVGESLELTCEGDDDDGFAAVARPIPVKIGTELHQPAFNGYPDGGFHPRGLLTRAETAAIVSRLEGLPAADASIISSSYNDVARGHWASEYIAKVTKAGWMTGDNGRFRPDAPISRGEFAVLLLRIRGITALPLGGFEDSNKHWAKDAIGTGKSLGYLSGDAKGSFDAEGAIAREDAAKLLDIALSRGELTDGQAKVIQHWPDVSRTAWSFGWVEELSILAHESKDKGLWKEELVRYAPENTLPF